ncbi:MAG TPA: choice-of-anchor tandem repeat GloVer-containing protein [Verrucomicrobiae bacterium]|nr:choice-of-anchor tandem repeat GloVer-containing protein [Verrucomicrobiae bacterium]
MAQPYSVVGKDGTESVLYAFGGVAANDGNQPQAGLIMDGSGNLYWTTTIGGMSCVYQRLGCGTVFKISSDSTETILHEFGNNDTQFPQSALVFDKNNNLLGTTQNGAMYKIAPDGTETIVIASLGGYYASNLVQDRSGNFYGTTGTGGDPERCKSNLPGCGLVFKVGSDGVETVLHTFNGRVRFPLGVTLYNGVLYGTAGGGSKNCGAKGCGTVFSVKK